MFAGAAGAGAGAGAPPAGAQQPDAEATFADVFDDVRLSSLMTIFVLSS